MILGSTTDVITPLFTVADPSHLWVLLDVPETDLNELKAGQDVELRTPAYPGRVFPGKLVVVGASLDPQTRVVHARGLRANFSGEIYFGKCATGKSEGMEVSCGVGPIASGNAAVVDA